MEQGRLPEELFDERFLSHNLAVRFADRIAVFKHRYDTYENKLFI